MAEIAVCGGNSPGSGHSGCLIVHHGLRPRRTASQSRAGLFTSCRPTCIPLELALCGDRDCTAALLRLLLFCFTSKHLETFDSAEYCTACGAGCRDRICA